MNPGSGFPEQKEVKILLLPFCLSREEMEKSRSIARDHGYEVIVATSTAFALSQVRNAAGLKKGSPVMIVGVVCDGRAKKVSIGLSLLKLRQFLKRILTGRTRKIYLSRVSINGGTRSMFGRRNCKVGENIVPMNELAMALAGKRVFLVL